MHSWAAVSALDTFSGDASLVEVSVAFVSVISSESSLVLRDFLSSVSTESTVLASSFAGALALAVLVEKKVYQIHSSTFQRIAGRARQGSQSIFLMIRVKRKNKL